MLTFLNWQTADPGLRIDCLEKVFQTFLKNKILFRMCWEYKLSASYIFIRGNRGWNSFQVMGLDQQLNDNSCGMSYYKIFIESSTKLSLQFPPEGPLNGGQYHR